MARDVCRPPRVRTAKASMTVRAAWRWMPWPLLTSLLDATVAGAVTSCRQNL